VDFCDAEIIRELRHMHELVPVHVSAAVRLLAAVVEGKR